MRFLCENSNNQNKKTTINSAIWQNILDEFEISYIDLANNFNISLELSNNIIKEAKANKLIKISTEYYSINNVPEFFNLITNKISEGNGA